MKLFFSLAVLSVVAASQAQALFSDDFESGSLSGSKWAVNMSGQVVADPLNASNKVLNFASLGSGGDLFSTATAIPATGTTMLSFDYLGQPVSGSGATSGGFLGTNDPYEHWYFGTGGYPTTVTLADDGAWHHYSIALPQGVTASIKIEDFAGSDNIAGNAYFDNVKVQAVPEPATMAALGVGALGMLRRRASK